MDKVPKQESGDDAHLFTNANGRNLLDRVPKEEGGGLTVSMDNHIVPYNEKIIKEEIIDEDEYDPSSLMVTNDRLEYFYEHMVKEEEEEEEVYGDDDEYDNEEEMDTEMEQFTNGFMKIEPEFIKQEPETEPVEPQSALIWRPNLTSLSDLTSLDHIEGDDIDMGLGSSILFNDHNHRPERLLVVPKEPDQRCVTPINFDDEDDPNFKDTYGSLLPRKQMAAYKIKKILNERFEDNRHPTASEMIKIAENCGVRYRTVFEDFESRRAAKKVKCPKNDPCEKIRSFFQRDGDNMCYNRVNNSVKRILEDEIELHLLSRKRFSIGHVHVIMEKTDLPPAYIRGQYETWKKKMLTKDRDEYKHKEGKRESEDPSSLPMETLRKLEDAYLRKKYECQETEWSPKEYKSLAAQLDLEEKTVTTWMEKRKEAVLGLDYDIYEMRKKKMAKTKANDGRKLPTNVTDVLNAEFGRNSRPTVARRMIIAKKLNLTELQVRNYFNKKRIHKRRLVEWEKARQDVIKMPRSKVEEMERIAAEKRKPTNEYIVEAKKIGVAHMTLISFVNWRKSVNAYKCQPAIKSWRI